MTDITIPRAVVEQALEALEQTLQTLDDENAKPGGAIADTIWHSEHETLFDYLGAEITAIKEALAEHAMSEVQRLGQEIEQEPVISKWVLREVYFDEDGEPVMHRSPPQRKPLTENELFKLWVSVPAETEDRFAFARAIEAAHGIKGEA